MVEVNSTPVIVTVSPQAFGTTKKKRRLPLAVRFAVQIVTGALAFGVVAAVAVALRLGVERLNTVIPSGYVITGLRCLDLLIFSSDMICMLCFVIFETASFVRALHKEWKEEL